MNYSRKSGTNNTLVMRTPMIRPTPQNFANNFLYMNNIINRATWVPKGYKLLTDEELCDAYNLSCPLSPVPTKKETFDIIVDDLLQSLSENQLFDSREKALHSRNLKLILATL